MVQSTELDILKDVVLRLESNDFSYMLTGSVAMTYYAEPRMTRDIDLVIAINEMEIPGLLELFKDDYYLSEEAVIDAIKNTSMFNLIHLESVVKIDFIIRKVEEYRQIEFDRRMKINFVGIPLWIVSKEDLVLSKLIWMKDSNSELQSRDIKNLLTGSYDEVYLTEWARKLKVYELMEKIKSE